LAWWHARAGRRDSSARWRAGVLAHVAGCSSDAVAAAAWRGGDAEAFYPYVGGEVVSWTGGESTRHTRACQRTPVTRLRMRAGRLRRGLDGVLSAVTARPVERPARGLRRRAPGVGTLVGAAMGSSRAVAAVMGHHGAPQPT
jgi:hypothetical protein